MTDNKNKIDIGLLLGGDKNFVKSVDLVGLEFQINSYEMESVNGYDTEAMKIEIIHDKETTYWSTFSAVIMEQVKRLEKADALPCTVKLSEKPSEKRKGKKFLVLEAI